MASERLIAQRTRRPKQTVDKKDRTTSDLSCLMLVIGAPIIRRKKFKVAFAVRCYGHPSQQFWESLSLVPY
jgi:hypothetical protein